MPISCSLTIATGSLSLVKGVFESPVHSLFLPWPLKEELPDLVQAVDHLKKTNFRYRQDLIDRFFSRQHGRKA